MEDACRRRAATLAFARAIGTAREIDDPVELERANEAICETVNASDYGECLLHLRGLPTRAKIKALHRYWFDTGTPIVVELSD